MKAELYFDGGARPRNPGYSACAFILTIENQGAPIEFSRYLGIGTNNKAEYTGLIVGLKMAFEKGVSDIDIYTDSKLIEGHLQKQWMVGGELSSKVKLATELLAGFERWNITWVDRSRNTSADALCVAAINWGRSRNPWALKLKGPFEPAYIKDPYANR